MKPIASFSALAVAAFLAACSSSSDHNDAARSDATDTLARSDAADALASDAAADSSAPDVASDTAPTDATTWAVPPGRFLFDGPRDAGSPVLGSHYTMQYAPDGGVGGTATLGSPCHAASDCAGLGPGAGCYASGSSGFCTVDCPGESATCADGFVCARGLNHQEGGDFGLCLPRCNDDASCAGFAALPTCSGPFAVFTPAGISPYTACFPSCATDPDCDSDVSQLLCNPVSHACVAPAYYVGSQCASDADCRNLGPGGACLQNTANPSDRYCTAACDPATTEDCVSGYATDSSGADVPVLLKSCVDDTACQVASRNTCNYFPATGRAYCSIRCASDADCPSGTCNVASGDCQQTAFWAAGCAAASNCPLGLCVADFHSLSATNCTRACHSDADCAGLGVCVTSPDAVIPNGGHLTDGGFCAPACTPDAGACADPTARCLTPVANPEIDFAAQGAASSPFCWR